MTKELSIFEALQAELGRAPTEIEIKAEIARLVDDTIKDVAAADQSHQVVTLRRRRNDNADAPGSTIGLS